MAITTEVKILETFDGSTVSSARLQLVDDIDGRVVHCTIRQDYAFNNPENYLDPHGVIPFDFLPAISVAMDEILGSDLTVVRNQRQLVEVNQIRSY